MTFIFILVQRLKRGFNKYVSLSILDLLTQTCFSIIKNNIFKIGNSFKKSDGQRDIPKGNIPFDLHVYSVPSIFMHCLGWNGPLKKACLASEVSESCLKNSPKKMQTWEQLKRDKDWASPKYLVSWTAWQNIESQKHTKAFSKINARYRSFFCFRISVAYRVVCTVK